MAVPTRIRSQEVEDLEVTLRRSAVDKALERRWPADLKRTLEMLHPRDRARVSAEAARRWPARTTTRAGNHADARRAR